MKKLLFVATIAAVASGCVYVTPANSITAPIALDVQCPAGSVDNDVKPAKMGTATASGIILFCEGDASLKAAMDNGGIKKVHHVDYKTKNILGIVSSATTIVWGE